MVQLARSYASTREKSDPLHCPEYVAGWLAGSSNRSYCLFPNNKLLIIGWGGAICMLVVVVGRYG